ncbi:hypothetical protein Tco_1412670 [Tanacetum coccineum]
MLCLGQDSRAAIVDELMVVGDEKIRVVKRERLRDIRVCVNLDNFDQSFLIAISDEMKSNFDMLGPKMSNRGGVGYNDGGGGDSGWRWWFRWQRWRVAESEYGDRVDPLMRITFDFGRKSRRKTFPAAVNGGGVAAVVAEY